MNFWLILLVVIVFLAIFTMQFIQRQNPQEASNTYAYRKIDPFLTPAERSFFGVLTQIVNEEISIFSKVRVADVISPAKGLSRSDWQKAFNKISSKHFDFLLCNTDDLSILCALELDDKSHNAKNRNERDLFLNSACESSNVPLIQIKAEASYKLNEIKQTLSPYISKPSTQVPTEDTIPKIEMAETDPKIATMKTCPKCSCEMVKKTAKKGNNVGNEFWACSGFPQCRYIESISA